LSQAARDGKADPAARSRDERDLACQGILFPHCFSFIAGRNDILCPGFLVQEIVIITSVPAAQSAVPERGAMTSERKQKGILLAPWDRIPYNPRVLSQQTFLQILFAIDFLKFAEEAGSR
jgi:hypothetical protein